MPHVFGAPHGSSGEKKGPRTVPAAPKPTSTVLSPLGRWIGRHPGWQAPVEIRQDGTFFTSFQSGKWTFDGRFLRLAWDLWPVETLEVDSHGIFRVKLSSGYFTLRRT
jgi:hypothetical protein